MAKAKKLTLRQRLREDAKKKLDQLIVDVDEAARKAVGKEAVSEHDVMRLATSTQTKSLENKLITQLADAMERDLERLYESQRGGDNG